MEENKIKKPWGMEIRSFCMLMHLSQLTSFVIPGAGIVLPIVMWATNKDEHPEIDLHGRLIVNWILSFIIYLTISFILCFIYIGFFALVALFIIDIVFIIIASVKANDGIYWRYPLSIKIFKYDDAALLRDV